MRLPFKTLRRARYDELVAAAAAGEVDAQEAVALEAQRDEIREDRNALIEKRAGLQVRIEALEEELERTGRAHDRLQEEADESANDAERLGNQLESKARELQRLLGLLSEAEHGDAEVFVLLSNGAAISAHRTYGGARRYAQCTYRVPETEWTATSFGQSVTDGWVITKVQLVGDQPKAVAS
ncbi:hypothetical protein [Streptomyces syringium]|uniref:hypothetical protein n=1 Tax=Streptomyces syringium TaxID=76729 RepID=UPI003AAB4974